MKVSLSPHWTAVNLVNGKAFFILVNLATVKKYMEFDLNFSITREVEPLVKCLLTTFYFYFFCKILIYTLCYLWSTSNVWWLIFNINSGKLGSQRPVQGPAEFTPLRSPIGPAPLSNIQSPGPAA